MAELILVRHGQANSTAQDAESYDNLSPLGIEQGRWLGEALQQGALPFSHTVCGTLRRHHQTAAAMGQDLRATDPRLDEFDYFGLAQQMQAEHGIAMPQDGAGFAAHVPVLLDHWQRRALSDVAESFNAFETRVAEALNAHTADGGRVLLVTSGGVISMALRLVLGLDLAATGKIMLQVMNSSLHRIERIHGQMMLAQFNATPHLDAPERAHARTFV
ncbi:histidine phosphatase family protein [Pseudoruegeria sp. SHC-113]|uniref:histidine phosphatase family protein n=1 Tax=Pseudoruegeria sp. SHC-113 TaxID=2855439 RepID=UPI0021BA88BB|nr:histidine phosphatase family protein [Pseudoruegeria sp. SHC-113]MCT8161983.1 histidine phosphatase family protein [Pseudoruegeria sp. SHC-113]